MEETTHSPSHKFHQISSTTFWIICWRTNRHEGKNITFPWRRW